MKPQTDYAMHGQCDRVVAATQREKRRLKGIEAISLRVSKVMGKYRLKCTR
ncbi:MAG: hypothetical protein OXI10_15585 [Gammaproteobacteria bacterium]|nr:hypothetical protein [Gammaproteobacteria bacterium]MDE0716266.1 hypothetical protein [Gammaproteobacteria bacterium]